MGHDLNNLRQRPSLHLLNNHVNVVRHDAPSRQAIALAIKVQERPLNDRRHVITRQQTQSEIRFDTLGRTYARDYDMLSQARAIAVRNVATRSPASVLH